MYLCFVKLTLKIKLLPSEEQVDLIIETLKEANNVCNEISEVAWSKKVFNNFKLHHEVYHPFKNTFRLSSQVLIRQIAKVANAYKLDKKTKRTFKPLGGISYDSRILNYKPDQEISLWCIGGRQRMKYICHNTKYIPYTQGEADLVYKKGKFYLFQTVDIPDEDISDVEGFIGVDFGIADIAVTSTGKKYSAKELNDYREKRQRVRSSLQRKGTRGAKRLLKRLSGKEKTFSTIVNHTVSKDIVNTAILSDSGISVEDLTGIRKNNNVRNKSFQTKLGKWNFRQLRDFIEYKSKLNGVPFVVVNPAYTSKTCNICKYIGKRSNKKFQCNNCNEVMDADLNASINISSIGAAINQPEKWGYMSCTLTHV